VPKATILIDWAFGTKSGGLLLVIGVLTRSDTQGYAAIIA